jgi:hypothetical protein
MENGTPETSAGLQVKPSMEQAGGATALSPTEMRIKILKEKYGIDFSDLPEGNSDIVIYRSGDVVALGGQTFPIKESLKKSGFRFFIAEKLWCFKFPDDESARLAVKSIAGILEKKGYRVAEGIVTTPLPMTRMDDDTYEEG